MQAGTHYTALIKGLNMRLNYDNGMICCHSLVTVMMLTMKVMMTTMKVMVIRFLKGCGHSPTTAVHCVYIGQYIYLATEQTETYCKSCILIYLLTYICPSSFDCEVNTNF